MPCFVVTLTQDQNSIFVWIIVVLQRNRCHVSFMQNYSFIFISSMARICDLRSYVEIQGHATHIITEGLSTLMQFCRCGPFQFVSVLIKNVWICTVVSVYWNNDVRLPISVSYQSHYQVMVPKICMKIVRDFTGILCNSVVLYDASLAKQIRTCITSD